MSDVRFTNPSATPDPKTLILAEKVKGRPVFNPHGVRIGHVEDLAIGKSDGEVAYAILAAGGLLGAGEKYHPIRWAALTFNPALQGYVVAIDREDLEGAPTYRKDQLADVGDDDLVSPAALTGSAGAVTV